jgi:hypothetical protein
LTYKDAKQKDAKHKDAKQKEGWLQFKFMFAENKSVT